MEFIRNLIGIVCNVSDARQKCHDDYKPRDIQIKVVNIFERFHKKVNGTLASRLCDDLELSLQMLIFL